MKHGAVLFAMLTLVACSEPPEHTWTVSDFIDDDALRAQHIEQCRQDPGALQDTANCRNAEEAEGRARIERMNQALGG